MSDYIPQDISNQFNQANQAAGQVGALTGAGANLESELRAAVSERFKNSSIGQERDTAAANLLSAGPNIRADLAQTVQQTPLSPSQQAAIESSRRASAAVPLISLNDLAQKFTGGIDTAVNTGLGAFNSLISAATQRAQGLRQSATDALNLFGTGQQLKQQDFENQIALAKLNQSNQPPLGQSLLEQLIGGGRQPTEPQPQYSPIQNGVFSPGGEWQFQDSQWVPVQQSGGFGDLDLNDPRTQLSLMALTQADSPSEILAATNNLFPVESRITSEKNTQFSNAAQQLAEVVNLAGSAPTGFFGSLASNLGRIPGVGGGDAEQLRRVSRGLAKNIADVFAVGESRPTDEDIERWLDLMPRPGDTESERKIASTRLLSAIISNASAKNIQVPEDIINLAISYGVLQ